MSTFIDRLAEAMKEKKLTQKALSVAIGITDAYMSQISTGKRKPAPRTAKDLAEALGVNVEWLMDGTGAKKPDLSREELIAETVASVLNDKPGSFQERVIKMLASLTYEEKVFLQGVIDSLASQKEE